MVPLTDMEHPQEAMLRCNQASHGFDNCLRATYKREPGEGSESDKLGSAGVMACVHPASSLLKLEPCEKPEFDFFTNAQEDASLVDLGHSFKGEENPESPFSVQSSSSHGSYLAFNSKAYLSDVSLQKQPSLPGNALPEAVLLQPNHPENSLYMEDEETTSLNQPMARLVDLPPLQQHHTEAGFTFTDNDSFWPFPAASAHAMPVSPLSSGSSNASEAAQFCLNSLEYVPLQAMPLMYPTSEDAAFQLDGPAHGLASSPRDHHASKSIFDDIGFQGLATNMHESAAEQNYNAQSLEDFDPSVTPPFGHDALQHAQGFAEEGLPPPRKQGPARRAKTAAAKRTPEDLDGSDYVPHTKRKRPAGNKAKKAAAKRAAVYEEIEGEHEARRTSLITARGRTVNRLQLSEEDNSDDSPEGSNRRCKHHNPWSVEETEALVSGVESCGGGKWADIKKLGLQAIEKRSAVDLKDKWRNLQAALHRPKCDKKREIPASLLQRVRLLVPLTATKARAEARPNAARAQGRLRERSSRRAAAGME